MFKIVFGLTRKAELSRSEFRKFWLEDHAPKVAKLPGLRRYVVDIVEEDDEANSSPDGYAILWFDSREAFEAAFGSDYGRDVVLPNNRNFNQPEKIVRRVVEENIIEI